MARRRVAAAGLFALFLVMTSACAQAEAPIVGSTNDWTFVAPPVAERLRGLRSAAATFTNHLDTPVLGIVIMVIHNYKGQTVYYSTATVSIAPGSYGTAYAVEFGLSPDIYNATMFAMSTSGVAISTSTTISFTAG